MLRLFDLLLLLLFDDDDEEGENIVCTFDCLGLLLLLCPRRLLLLLLPEFDGTRTMLPFLSMIVRMVMTVLRVLPQTKVATNKLFHTHTRIKGFKKISSPTLGEADN